MIRIQRRAFLTVGMIVSLGYVLPQESAVVTDIIRKKTPLVFLFVISMTKFVGDYNVS